jgi:hypothetical protein
MSRLVLIVAKSGTGKSSSMRNFAENDLRVISCSGKELPFKSNIKSLYVKTYGELMNAVVAAERPVVVVDDINYIMSFDQMSRVLETGYTKFTLMAKSITDLFKTIVEKDSDQTYYVIGHQAEQAEGDSQIRLKTPGKMVSNTIVLEGLTNILITTDVVDNQFVFRVQTDGTGVKTPMGMFDTLTIENDLKLVDKTIREFYK